MIAGAGAVAAAIALVASAQVCPPGVSEGWTARLAPRPPRAITRVHGTVRPFFNLLGPGGGGIADLAVERYFAFPLKLGAGISPAAFAVQPGGGGAVTHLRVEAALATDYLELGAAAGARLENLGAGGVSLAARLRLGALDGLSLGIGYGYALIRNRYHGESRVAFSNLLATLQVPLVDRLWAVLDGGFSFDVWLFATAGLRHRLAGDGGGGSWFVQAGFGLAWVLQGFPCQYREPERCEGAAWGLGPTIAAGLERRF